MTAPVTVELIGENLFRAQSTIGISFSAEGKTSEEAVNKVREKIDKQLAGGGEIAVLYPVAKTENPWLQIAGIYKDDPHFDEWQAEIREYRLRRDLDDVAT